MPDDDVREDEEQEEPKGEEPASDAEDAKGDTEQPDDGDEKDAAVAEFGKLSPKEQADWQRVMALAKAGGVTADQYHTLAFQGQEAVRKQETDMFAEREKEKAAAADTDSPDDDEPMTVAEYDRRMAARDQNDARVREHRDNAQRLGLDRGMAMVYENAVEGFKKQKQFAGTDRAALYDMVQSQLKVSADAGTDDGEDTRRAVRNARKTTPGKSKASAATAPKEIDPESMLRRDYADQF